MEVISLDEKEILDELKKIYGAHKSIDVLRNYANFINLKQSNEINFGNYNIFIRNQSEYGFVYKVVEIIWKLLISKKVINSSYRYLERDEIKKIKMSNDFKKLDEIEEELIIIDSKKIDESIYYLNNEVKKIIDRYPNKIFILIDKDERQGFINARIGDSITWTTEIEPISKYNKIDYIENFLKNNKIKTNIDSTFIDCLSDEPFWKVKNEILNIVFECKSQNIKIINDKIVKEKLKKDYYKKKTNDSKERKSGLQELDNLIGMEDVKKQIHQIINFIKINKKRGKMPSLHMCFMGNPGTGKTTVARIVGKIFSEMNILSNKKVFVEAQRGDLIGKYVGHTAPLTQEVIEKANGGVLFIDEAYSIASYVQDEAGRDFGAECIATLIKEMEDKRDELCVILAGYSNEINQMLKSNPGFESRIQFKINFPNYTENELYQIFKEMAKSEKYKLSSNIKQILIEYFSKEKKSENFSNARFVRNIFEKVKFEQADRVVKNEKEDFNLIKKIDIENIIKKNLNSKEVKNRIGFTV